MNINEVIVYFLLYNISDTHYSELKGVLIQLGLNEVIVDDLYNKQNSLLDNVDIKGITEKQKEAILVYITYYGYLTDRQLRIDNRLLKSIGKLGVSKKKLINIAEILESKRKEELLNGQNIIESVMYPNEKLIEVVNKVIEQINKEEIGNINGKKIILRDLSSNSYEHKFDKFALEKIKVMPGIDTITKSVFKNGFEKLNKIMFVGSNIKVTESNFPELYSIYIKACRILDMKKIPELYLQQGYLNAFTTGVEDPVVVLTAGTLTALTAEELMFVIGHELGHIKSEHLLYHTILSIIPRLGDIIGNVTFGLGDAVTKPIEIALYNWYRKSELTADRAGMLCCQNFESAIKTFMKISGAPWRYYDSLDTKEFLKQAKEFENLEEDTLDKIMKIYTSMYNTHPWTVIRAKELNEWVNSGEYESLLNRYSN